MRNRFVSLLILLGGGAGLVCPVLAHDDPPASLQLGVYAGDSALDRFDSLLKAEGMAWPKGLGETDKRKLVCRFFQLAPSASAEIAALLKPFGSGKDAVERVRAWMREELKSARVPYLSDPEEARRRGVYPVHGDGDSLSFFDTQSIETLYAGSTGRIVAVGRANTKMVLGETGEGVLIAGYDYRKRWMLAEVVAPGSKPAELELALGRMKDFADRVIRRQTETDVGNCVLAIGDGFDFPANYRAREDMVLEHRASASEPWKPVIAGNKYVQLARIPECSY